MNAKIVASMSLSSVGCTFLDWSILYLSGQDQFYSFNDKNYIPLSKDPITPINAHGHLKNHPLGLAQTQQHVEQFLTSNGDLLTLYPSMLILMQVAEHYGISTDSPEFVSSMNTKFKDHAFEDFKKLWHYLDSKQCKIIWINEDPNLMLMQAVRGATDVKLKSKGRATYQELDKEFQELFYHDSMSTWTNLGLTNIWDERERRALDIRPQKSYTMYSYDQQKEQLIPFDLPHLHITTAEWWTQGESVIRRVMQFCELDIDQTRWQHWTSVYNLWKGTMSNQLSFCYRLPTMLNAIVNNWYYELGELTFIQEVIIQHYLIYKYNLNLKTWNLDKFPSNAQDLHNLLEPNIHSVPNIYSS